MITLPNTALRIVKASDNKICQSCIDRGLDNPKPANHEWIKGYYICDDCFAPLINNLAGLSADEIINSGLSIKSSQFILQNRDHFFNHKALAIANLDLSELERQFENNRVVLFKTNIEQEAITIKIQELKAHERKNQGLSDREYKPEDNENRPNTTIQKVREDKNLKLLKALAKQTGKSIEELQEIGKAARSEEFKNISAGKKCNECGKLSCECTKRESVVDELKAITDNLRLSVAGISNTPVVKKCPLCKIEYGGTYLEHKPECKR